VPSGQLPIAAVRTQLACTLEEELQRLLVNELDHLVKNTLATVQAIVLQLNLPR